MSGRNHNGFALAGLVSVMTLPSGAVATDVCGGNNSAVVMSVPDARRMSMFALAYDSTVASPPTFTDRDHHPLTFVGNAFLIDVVDDGMSQIGYFVTAKHNVAAACEGAHDTNSLPTVRVVASNRTSVAVVGPSAAQCAKLAKLSQAAGAQPIVFNPDFAVLSGTLPDGGDWKPILVGSDRTPATTSNVEHLDETLSPQESGAGNLPTPAVEPQYAKYSWLRVINGHTANGDSGSPYVSTLEKGRPVVLGAVTNNIPSAGVAVESDDNSLLTTQEVQNLFLNMYPGVSISGHSLVSTFDVLADEYDSSKAGAGLAVLFGQAQQKGFLDQSYALRMYKVLASSGVSTIVYLRRQCEALPADPQQAINTWVQRDRDLGIALQAPPSRRQRMLVKFSVCRGRRSAQL